MIKDEFMRCQTKCQNRCFECDRLYTVPCDGQIFYCCRVHDAYILDPNECKYFKPWREDKE